MKKVFDLFKNPRMAIAFLYDVLVACISFWLALLLRVETYKSLIFHDPLIHQLFVTTTFFLILSFFLNGLYYGMWRFSSTHDLLRVIKASLMGLMSSFVVHFVLHRMDGVPRSLFPLQFLILVFGLGGGRFCYRFWKDYLLSKEGDDGAANVLIIGAGRAGERLSKEIIVNPSLKLKVVGFLDDDGRKLQRQIHNKKVLGKISEAHVWIKKLAIKKVFIAIPSLSSQKLKELKEVLDLEQVELKILPRMNHILNSHGELSLLRNISIEDLLGRVEISLNTTGINTMLNGKALMITGAGGSIGSELSLQLSKYEPREMIFLDSSEYNLYELEQKFRLLNLKCKISYKICDIRNLAKLKTVFAEFQPDFVFHAAAYKHVPMMELNPEEAFSTNILGTRNLCEVSIEFGVTKFIMVSTDKAVNPTNIMGASKRIAEMVCNYYQEKKGKTRFMSVRFGNVLGSSGSVIPLFKRQIEERRDLTVTHPDIIRYFMSIPEAAQLIIQAGVMGIGGEIFVLDMGEPVKIVDLAREMIKLAGLREGIDINILFTGLRPGEKMFEELFADKEDYVESLHEKIRIALVRKNEQSFETFLNNISTINSNFAIEIKKIVPEFTHYSLEIH